ncbi:hypothetical protein IC620_15820 [Hazenella sp. IB182357]|uniref:Uncharacterized protein n=1 Tax=Polycladospora coralii TaxID=2771432 RepID=A0A926NCP1_9BACL|nr:hypothetical protein [Polycladospora coralii]MBD1373812.1 hypothetical protein [Polycladospora coralii]MBS7531985.1 hypothetical protein [Polycladospora coralii]
MNPQKKLLTSLILQMMKEVYLKTVGLEALFHTNMIHIFKQDFNPYVELLLALELSDEESTHFSNKVQQYLEEQIDLDQLITSLP